MRVGLVVATDNAGGIGLNGTMPWRSRADMWHFATITKTMGGNIIMGRRTWESIGRPLDGRTMWIVSSSDPHNDASRNSDRVHWVRSPDDVKCDFVWAVGGSSIYDWAMSAEPDIAYITHLDGTFGCDVFFHGKFGELYESHVVGTFEQDAKNSCSGTITRYTLLK